MWRNIIGPILAPGSMQYLTADLFDESLFECYWEQHAAKLANNDSTPWHRVLILDECERWIDSNGKVSKAASGVEASLVRCLSGGRLHRWTKKEGCRATAPALLSVYATASRSRFYSVD